MESKHKTEYIKDEELDIERLEERKKSLEEKWIKPTGSKNEIEFLEDYIKQKKVLVKKIK